MIYREDILHVIDTFPPLPESASRVLAWYRQNERNAETIANAIEEDRQLTKDILHLAGNKYFKPATPPKTILETIEQIGDRQFFRLIMIPAVIRWLQNLSTLNDTPSWRLWDHCLTVAAGTEQLCKAMEIEIPKYAFTCGFLHDLGKAVFEKHLDIYSDAILERAEMERISVDEAERRMYGIDHMEIGAIILQKWNMPKTIVDTVRWHHLPESYPGDDFLLIDLVHIADAIALVMGIGPQSEGLNYKISPETEQRRQIKIGIVESVMCDIQSELIHLEEMLTPFIGEQN